MEDSFLISKLGKLLGWDDVQLWLDHFVFGIEDHIRKIEIIEVTWASKERIFNFTIEEGLVNIMCQVGIT